MKTPERKVALVTGAGRRLGRAIALALHREGYALVVHHHRSGEGARELVAKIRSAGGEAVAVRGDITSVREVKKVFSAALKNFGRIDLLVNNAAIFRGSTVTGTTEKTWDETLDTNIKGTFFCSQAAARVMNRRGGGVIINIASLGGIQAWTKHAAYSVSKAGVIMLTRILAKSLAPKVRVNAIAPGTIIMPGEETGLKHIPRRKIPLRSHGNSSDVTDLVVFLATKATHITGQVFTVDGGRSIQ